MIVENGYQNAAVMGGTNVFTNWTTSEGEHDNYSLGAGNGINTYYTIPGCVRFNTVTWPGKGLVGNLGQITDEGTCCYY